MLVLVYAWGVPTDRRQCKFKIKIKAPKYELNFVKNTLSNIIRPGLTIRQNTFTLWLFHAK